MPKIGLEIHGYLDTKEKLFCRCKAIYISKFTKPNVNICPVCTAQPGAKPMLPNKEVINKSIQICLILGCKINTFERKVGKKNTGFLTWQRKHYDWPDLPKGFQSTISGPYATPTGEKGKFKKIRIKEAHIEEDPASWNPNTGEIDYNKSGVPLIEIVTEPDFTNSEQVVQWLANLIGTLKYAKLINRDSGAKADVNISMPELKGERVELKNINSLANIRTAIEYEIQRQKKDIPKEQETRMFDESQGVTFKMRSKELAYDYRFISEPDLPVIKIEPKRIKELQSKLPITPEEKIKSIVKKYKIEKKHAEFLTKKLDIVEFFEEVVEKTNHQLAVNWVMGELPRILNYAKKELEDVNIQTAHFIELLQLIENKKITELKAKEILNKFIPESFSPLKEVKESAIISSEKEIEKLAGRIVKENPKAFKDYKSGKQEVLNFLIGQVMKQSNKRADFKTAREILVKLLR